MRIILCGGGTAGHVNPAIAVAEEIKKQDPEAEILFVGRDGGKENKPVVNAGIKIKTIKIEGLRRSITPDNIRRILSAIRAKEDAKKLIKRFKPDIVLGTGGYVTWPIISAAYSLGVPTAIHESNIYPGLTTKMLAKKCNVVLVNREETIHYLPKRTKASVVGNPLREDFSNYTKKQARKKLGIKEEEILIVSFGGSLGSEKMNNEIISVIKDYSSKQKDIVHIHGTGERYFSILAQEDKKYSEGKCKILSYIDNMPIVLRAADIAICRSGAMTISELCEAELTAILVPSPNVTNNHQFANAKHLSDKGAAFLIEEKNFNAKAIQKLLEDIKNDKNGRKKRAKILNALSTPNSAKIIVEELFLLKNNSKRVV